MTFNVHGVCRAPVSGPRCGDSSSSQVAQASSPTSTISRDSGGVK